MTPEPAEVDVLALAQEMSPNILYVALKEQAEALAVLEKKAAEYAKRIPVLEGRLAEAERTVEFNLNRYQDLYKAWEKAEGRLAEATEALRAIAEGNWNFGNLRPGLTVMEFAREALRAEPANSDTLLADVLRRLLSQNYAIQGRRMLSVSATITDLSDEEFHAVWDTLDELAGFETATTRAEPAKDPA